MDGRKADTKKPPDWEAFLFNGADTQNRTGDLILTKDALYRLSHISTLTGKDHAGRNLEIGCLAVSYSRMANATLPSALQRFTSEFGMGSGGSTALLPPGKIFNLKKLI